MGSCGRCPWRERSLPHTHAHTVLFDRGAVERDLTDDDKSTGRIIQAGKLVQTLRPVHAPIV